MEKSFLGKVANFKGVYHLRRFCIGGAELTGEGWSTAQQEVMAAGVMDVARAQELPPVMN